MSEPHREHHPLGTTAPPNKPCVARGTNETVRSTSPWQATFLALPTELHTNMLAHLDPVSQMCLGLTSSYFHRIFHFIYGSGDQYNIRRNPFDLRMQVSVCGKHFLNYVYEDWFLRDSRCIIWERSLGELLSDEKTLWGCLRCCGGCLKYKPEGAYGRCAFEKGMFLKHKKEIGALEAVDVDWYEGRCRRCRVKLLMVIMERKEEYFGEPEWECERESLGLVRENRGEDERSRELKNARTNEEYHAAKFNYESWESIFKRLCV
ncbi:hypothetical protein LOCC1_G006653 [Lachnellula occidentalis]|uniref:F-box domain-containing protein n=1 Tax=Lachnellula occidentalis TaxID=215460 RepID=A0A8H8RFX2_9HELO|nr:hypothetical protein LOCC1_G006653 [Lachnellula occidentalis]